MPDAWHDLIEQGRARIDWVESHARVMRGLRSELSESRPFAGLTIGMCLHVEPKTGVLVRTLQAGGARVIITGSPGTTANDTAAALAAEGALAIGARSDGKAEHARNIDAVLAHEPDLLIDNGADLIRRNAELGGKRPFAATEETTTGGNLLREEGPELDFPVIVINDSILKLVVENEYGVGQTVVEGFMRATNLLVPGRRVAVYGFGSVGRGIARHFTLFGARVMVVERDPIRGLEALMGGFQLGDADEALARCELFVTAIGRAGAIPAEHIARLPDGAILANAGHFSWEIALDELRSSAVEAQRLSEHIELFTMADGRHITLLGGGEMLNLTAANGNPAETMDLGFALQIGSLRHLAARPPGEPLGPHPVPRAVELDVARRMIAALQRT